MEAVCNNAVAATILLHADGDLEFEALSRFVFIACAYLTRPLKIIVREANNKLGITRRVDAYSFRCQLDCI